MRGLESLVNMFFGTTGKQIPQPLENPPPDDTNLGDWFWDQLELRLNLLEKVPKAQARSLEFRTIPWLARGTMHFWIDLRQRLERATNLDPATREEMLGEVQLVVADASLGKDHGSTVFGLFTCLNKYRTVGFRTMQTNTCNTTTKTCVKAGTGAGGFFGAGAWVGRAKG